MADKPEHAAAPADATPDSPDSNSAQQQTTLARRPLPGKIAYALAFLSGLLYFLAFPGVDLWPLGFIALTPLIIAIRHQTPRRALALGWVAGFTMTMTGFYWLLEMLKTFSGFGTALCLVFMSILCAYQAGRVGLMGWLAGRAELRGWPQGLVVTAAFIASELLFPLLFPWYFAATIHQIPVLTQTAELGGPILVGLVLLAANYALAKLVFARLDGHKYPWKLVGGLAAIPLVAAVYGLVRIHQVDAAVASAPKARAGIVQANMSLTGKRENKDEGLRRHLRLTQELNREEGPLDLVVWPETAVVGALDERRANQYYERVVLPQIGVPAVFGGVLVREVEDARGYVLFNSALVSGQDQKIVGRYDKHYLLAFGEYLPFGETFPKLYEISRNSGRFSPGKEAKPIPFGDYSLAVFICYEDIIPGFVNSIMQQGDAHLLVNLTNDAWFGDTTEPWIHLALAKLRSVEQRRFLVRSTNSGVSAIVDPVGRVVVQTGTFEEASVAASIAWLDGSTPYRFYGDSFWWLVSLLSFGMAFVSRERFKRRSEATS